MITLKVDDKIFQKDLNRFIKKSERGFRYAITKAVTTMQRAAVKKILQHGLVRSGFLKNPKNLRMLITDKGMTGAVISEASYSRAVEEGTRPHIIKIKNKKILAGHKRYAPAGWKGISGDYAIYGTKVVHPGTKPRPFMYPAWRFGMRSFERMVKAALK